MLRNLFLALFQQPLGKHRK